MGSMCIVMVQMQKMWSNDTQNTIEGNILKNVNLSEKAWKRVMHNCNYCDKEFNILEKLTNHVMKTHVPTGEVRMFMDKEK